MDIMKYLSGMLNYNPNIDYIEEQQFTVDGMPIPMSGYPLVQNEAVPKMMTPPEPDRVIEANEIGQELKKSLIAGAKEFLGGGMFSQPKRDTGGRNTPVKKLPSLKTSEKPGWMMAEGTNFWSVNTDDPYWDSEEGYQEALALYGTSPAWSTRPIEQENKFANFEPTVVASNLKKYF